MMSVTSPSIPGPLQVFGSPARVEGGWTSIGMIAGEVKSIGLARSAIAKVDFHTWD